MKTSRIQCIWEDKREKWPLESLRDVVHSVARSYPWQERPALALCLANSGRPESATTRSLTHFLPGKIDPRARFQSCPPKFSRSLSLLPPLGAQSWQDRPPRSLRVLPPVAPPHWLEGYQLKDSCQSGMCLVAGSQFRGCLGSSPMASGYQMLYYAIRYDTGLNKTRRDYTVTKFVYFTLLDHTKKTILHC